MSQPPVMWFGERSRAPRGDVDVVGLGLGERLPPLSVDRPRGMDQHLLIHFHDPVDIVLDGQQRRHPAHTLVIWPPRSPHRFGRTRPWRHSWLLAGGARIAAAIAASGLPRETPIAQAHAGHALRYLDLIRLELMRPEPADAAIVEGLLSLWLREAFRASVEAGGGGRPIPARMLAVRRAIDADPARSVSLADLARIADLSVSRLSAEFQRCFGTAPMRYVLDLRLKRSLFYLADRNLSIKQAAARSGFPDQRYFARRFRARFGRAPGDERGR